MSYPTKPWSGAREALFSAVIFLAVLGLYSLTWFQDIAAGVSTIGAERVLRGEMPYRDFWTMYAPGHFYLLALLFRIFGSHILVERIAASVVCAGAGLVCYWIVLNLVRRRLAAIGVMAIFVAATFNTGYFRNLGTYPPSIFFVLAAINLMVLHYKTGKLGYVIAAGLTTGAAAVFKHDVGGYTAIAIVAGLIGHHFAFPQIKGDRRRALVAKLSLYGSGLALIVLPVAAYFAVLARWDALQDVIIFPLTDFRFSRGEHYPSIFEFDIYGRSFLNSVSMLFGYIKFTLPFLLLVFGLTGVALAVRKRKPEYVAPGVMLSVAYLFHYAAAHVQINTHIISMSIYAALLGVVFFDWVDREFGVGRFPMTKLMSWAVVGVWFLSLAAKPVEEVWTDRKKLTAELKLPKVSGQRVSPQLKSFLSELLPYVDANISRNEPVFVGMHRHDVVITGANHSLYFMLDRPIATRYNELHPAIVDTAAVQREMIRDLQKENVALLILYRRFPDEVLDKVKRGFLKNLPQVGATDLDRFIRANYVQIRAIGKHAIWKRKDRIAEGNIGESTHWKDS